MKRHRDRGCTDAATVALRLGPFASKSKSFVKYHDEETFDKLPGIRKEMLLPHLDVIEAVGSSCLTKKTAEQAMQILAQENAEKWKHSPDMQAEWVSIMSRRVRNLLHHWGIAVKNKSAWALEANSAFGEQHKTTGEAETGVTRDGTEEKDKATQFDDMEVGWDIELGLGWRGKPGCEKEDREVALAVEDDGTASDSEPVLLQFEDGSTYPLDSVKMGDIRRPPRQSESEILWESVHKVTNHRVWLCQRVDRSLLVSAYEQGKQICQLRADLFGQVPDQKKCLPKSHQVIMKAVEFYTPLMEKFLNDELKDKHELQKARDEKLLLLGLKAGKTKRTAEGQAGESTPDTAKPSKKAKQQAQRTSMPKKKEASPGHVEPGSSMASTAVASSYVDLVRERMDLAAASLDAK